MARVHVAHDIDDLFSDLRTIQRQVPGDMRQTVLSNIRGGNTFAKNLARRENDADSHSRKYPGTFSAEMGKGFHGFGSSIYVGEYGPRHSGQGMLAPILENGSRSGNAPQMNLARSLEVIGPRFGAAVHDLPDRWFWPES